MVEREHRSTAKTVFIVMLIIELIIVLTIFVLTIVFSSPDNTPSFMGQSFYISDIDKMDEAVKVGSMVVAKNGRPNSSVVGGVILCENIDGFGTGIFRVVGVETTTDTFIYKVCLDGAPEAVFDIDAKNVVGECKYSFYTLGRIVLFVKSKLGVVVCVVIPALLLALIELILGFAKELRKRELQRKRETVKKEQAKRYSTKRKREKAFSVDDFKNEDVDLKRKHLKSNRNDEARPRRAVRSLSSGDERTRLMDMSANRKSASENDFTSEEINAKMAVDTEERMERYDAPEYMGVLSGRSRRDDKTIYDIRESNQALSSADAKPEPALDAEVAAEEVQKVNTDSVTEATEPTENIERPKPKKPSMSLEEMMKLMQDNKQKLQKDIEKNKTNV